MLRCSIRHLLLAVVVVVVVAAVSAMARASAGLAIFVALVALPFSSRVAIASRRHGETAAGASWVGLIAASAFQAILGVWGALVAGWSVAYWVERATGSITGPLNLGCGLVAATVVLVGLADPFFWWGPGGGAVAAGKHPRG